jgi:hypothetical protein
LQGTATAGFSGNGGPAVSAEIGGGAGIAVDGLGDVLFVDGEQIREISG